MKQVLCLIILLSLPVVAVADTLYGVKQSTQERVLTLPQDQDKWYVSVFGEDNSDSFLRVKAWFTSHEGLVSLRNQSHYAEYPTSSAHYQQRYKASVPALPCVRVQDAKGVVISEFYGEYIPMSAEAMYRGITADIEDGTANCFRRRRCQPQPKPEPKTEPAPAPVPPPKKKEPKKETTPARSNLPPAWLVIVAALIGGACGAVQRYRETYYPK